MARSKSLISSAILVGLALASLLVLFQLLNSPPSQTRRFLAFSVLSGESFMSIATRLEAEGLVRSKNFFYYLGRVTGRSRDLKAGEYELNSLMTARELLQVVSGSSVKLYRVTIKEGMTMFQIAALLDDMALVDRVQFLELCWDPVFLEELSIPSFSAEGYLFPETYFLARGTSARKIIRGFVDRFWDRVDESYLERAKILGMSIHEAVIMASVIEKETGLAGEMSLISSTFHNRLRKGMRIQSDPTAIYDILPYGGRVTREHLFRKSPFNTYQIPALPLGPISNPGILAIHAALYPQQTEYLFFVSRRDGSHHFSKTYDEHKAAIDKFLK